MFKVNNKATLCSSVSTVTFNQVNVGWDDGHTQAHLKPCQKSTQLTFTCSKSKIETLEIVNISWV